MCPPRERAIGAYLPDRANRRVPQELAPFLEETFGGVLAVVAPASKGLSLSRSR
jgi:hypothetical protein